MTICQRLVSVQSISLILPSQQRRRWECGRVRYEGSDALEEKSKAFMRLPITGVTGGKHCH
ncbi:hypothetical protein SERLA73DRAFT_129680 [Serpula lacrymans var. lacrymans S7.3]|uniref:Uncharacterized protein n=2 Tax=Serpula lacrymans var. lacrymans TaxID=341189 RepID=F8PIL2_SERL3|nr:uncharacterized protein SERLADRAFT_377605 [Serpula lacrymans var. lacrymans S7.9]EGO03383.1 hypothetical protein SERLA73DRAFT_129680 [Serpula lacrymans var. lacrymans S7.3]EGO29154.1 hypothetical protein SERLADRAFT_377605 [Serpula lacrymans var. lacrymans S7.9]